VKSSIMVTLAIRLTALPLAAGHMSLISPSSRNAIDRKEPRWAGGKWWPYEQHCAHPRPGCSTVPGTPGWNPQVPTCCFPNNTDGTPTDGYGCNCFNGTSACDVGQSCFWFSNGCTIGCKTCTGVPANPNTKALCSDGMNATLNNPELRTYNRNVPAGSKQDIYKHNPWRAPGFAPVLDACGMASGGPVGAPTSGESKYYKTAFASKGDLGSALPRQPTGVVWRAGGVATAKWSIRANHGGGYSYRLCPASEPLTEECFQRHPLRFASRVQQLELADGTRVTINGTYVDEGTRPAGSQWAMNPLPYSNSRHPAEFPPPCDETVDRTKSDTGRCSGRDPFDTLIADELEVPSLPAGSYVLGIRWDCEKSAQVWSGCADIELA